MCFTSIDILAAAGRWWSKSLRRPRGKRHCDDDAPKRLASSAWGSPLAKPAAARWHLHINAATGWPPGRHRTGRRPWTGAPGKMSKQQPGAAQQIGLLKIFFYKRKKSTADDSPPLHAEVS